MSKRHVAPSAKLTLNIVSVIKARLLDRSSTVADLAVEYSVSKQTIYLIGIGATWPEALPPGRVLRNRELIDAKKRDAIYNWKRRRNATCERTAERFGISTSAVSRAVQDAYAAMALRVQRAVLSSGNYDIVGKEFSLKRAEIEEFLAYIAEGNVPGRVAREFKE